MSNVIHHEISFSASSQQIYQALTDAKQFSEFTNAPAEIKPVVGGQFSCFGGMITGQTIDIIPGEMLVQAWRVQNWDSGVYSIVKFVFKTISEGKTILVFDHSGFPVEQLDHLEQGWHDRYWNPLKKYVDG